MIDVFSNVFCGTVEHLRARLDSLCFTERDSELLFFVRFALTQLDRVCDHVMLLLDLILPGQVERTHISRPEDASPQYQPIAQRRGRGWST